MDFRKINLMYIVLVMCAGLGLLSGCIADIDGNYDGFSSGFNYKDYMRSNTVIAARSDKTEFDVDDVTLDFYFGWYKYPPFSKENTSTFEGLFVALYFSGPEGIFLGNVEDYHNVENNYFVAEYTMEEFVKDDFSVNITKSSGMTFKNSKNLTVPRELFDDSSTTFCFWVRYIQYSYESNNYLVFEGEYLEISYEFVNDKTIRLSK